MPDERPLPRVSPPRIFPVATRASRPPADSAGSADAYRQAGFVLGDDLDLAIRGLELEGAIAEAASGARHRNQVVASGLALWSRSWLARLQALHAVEWGNYSSAFPLLRASADYEAASIYLLQTSASEWDDWLISGAIAPAPADHATEIRLTAFRAAEVMATNEPLARIYRATTDLTMPHFATSVLLTASDSTPERVLATFGDRDFHVGLAQLALGWVLELSVLRLAIVTAPGTPFPVPDAPAVGRFAADVAARLAIRDRCRLEIVERGGHPRYLIHEWRRVPSAQGKRLLL
ncbi:MAG TPA: hypothetical protein VFK32_05770 [Tepidiformaceae bacterium]|nr:hypothetical protein [Tepidiformaceae bacterium]